LLATADNSVRKKRGCSASHFSVFNLKVRRSLFIHKFANGNSKENLKQSCQRDCHSKDAQEAIITKLPRPF